MMRPFACLTLLCLGTMLAACNRSSDDGLQAMGARVHHAVSTSNPAAQQYFDEGLTLVYAFNRDQAFAAFHHAANADPRLAAAYWGEALAQGPNINYPITNERLIAGRRALTRSRYPGMHASDLERALINALSTRFTDGISDAQRALRYDEAMMTVAARYPNDDDVQTLAAESLLDRIGGDNVYDDAGKPNALTNMLTEMLATVLQRNPKHIGANHLWIHALDASRHPYLAMRSARYLSSLAYEPAASHLAHMGSHIFVQIGDWQSVAADNDRAIALDEQLAGSLHVDPTLLDYYAHNLDFAVGAELMRGNFDAANAFLPRFGGKSDDFIAEYLVFEEAWPAVRALPAPRDPFNRAVWRYALVLADIAEHHRSALYRDHAAFLHDLPADVDGDLAIIAAVERGCVDFARRNRDDGEAAFAQALRLQGAQPYDEIPEWRFPIRRQLTEARAETTAASTGALIVPVTMVGDARRGVKRRESRILGFSINS